MKKLLVLLTALFLFVGILNACEYVRSTNALVYDNIQDSFDYMTCYIYRYDGEEGLSLNKNCLEYQYIYSNTYDTFEGRDVSGYRYYAIRNAFGSSVWLTIFFN